MRRVALMLTVAIVMAAMIVVSSAMPAMASNAEEASGGRVCTAPGIPHAHATVPEKNVTAHSNIPCG